MSIRSFQGAEIQLLASEMLIGSHSASLVRDTSIKVTGIASWKMSATASDFFETAKTKAATDVIAACSLQFRLNGGAPGKVYRICTGGTDGSNAGRWYLGHDARVLKIYSKTNVVKDTGTTLSASTWYHIMLIDDGTTAYVYINGILDMSWAHGEGAWNAKSWGPSVVQTVGKGVLINHWFDDVCCFDDQDGRMDHLTPSGFRNGTDETWRVERSVAISDVVTDYTPSAGGAHYLLVDDEPDDTGTHVDTPSSPFGQIHIVREDGTDYTLSPPAAWGFTFDVSPAGDPWTDTLWNTLSTGQRDGAGNKELLEVETAALIGVSGVGSERIRAVRFLQNFQSPGVPKEFYVWRDTVLIGPDDPAAPASTFTPRVIQY